MLDRGEVGSLGELAERYDLHRSYVGRILRLAGLAPDIVEAIMAGGEPPGLSLRKLNRDHPMLWSKQRWTLQAQG
jgi:site-specific DNA recombinase